MRFCNMGIVMETETRGLLCVSLHEALGGFAANRFPADQKPRAEALILKLNEEKAAILENDDLNLAVEVLHFALLELGPEEFHTITGYEFEFGETTLKSFEVANSNKQQIGD